MEVGKLTVQVRTQTGKGIARRLRTQGLVPGVCYGTGLEAPLSISLDPKVLKASLDPEKRGNTVIDLTVEQDGVAPISLTAMLKTYQIHPIRRDVIHVDFISIDPDAMLETHVPVKLVGEAVGSALGGQIHLVLRNVTVRCKPADIPAKIELDITELDIGDALHVYDLVFPGGIETMTADKLAVVTMTAPIEDEVVAEEEVEGEGVEGAAAPADGEKPADDKAADAKGDAKGDDKKK